MQKPWEAKQQEMHLWSAHIGNGTATSGGILDVAICQ